MKKFTSFFKYCSDSQAVIDGIFKNHKVRFTQPWGMNDPLEFNPTLKFSSINNPYQDYELKGIRMPSIELFYRVQLIESQINSFGILSLTKQPLSFDMWSKYANGHKGFLLELRPDFINHPCMRSKSGNKYRIQKVKYVKEYFLDIEKLSDDSGNLHLSKLQDEVFYKKAYRWKHEKEYRVVRPFSDMPSYNPLTNHPHRDSEIHLFDFSLECIKSVVFGACTSSENKRLIAQECDKYNIDLYQSFVLRNQHDGLESFGDIIIANIKNISHLDDFFNMKPYYFIRDAIEHDITNSLEINRIEDLPYYEGNENVINTLYNDLLKVLKK
jgi:hypothetical protein